MKITNISIDRCLREGENIVWQPRGWREKVIRWVVFKLLRSIKITQDNSTVWYIFSGTSAVEIAEKVHSVSKEVK